MMDPVTLVLVVTCVQGFTRLVDAFANRLTMRARAELARAVAAMPQGVEVTDQTAEGTGWVVRRTGAQDAGR